MKEPGIHRASSLRGDDRPVRGSSGAARRGTLRYVESLLDQAVEDTFPASDPPATGYPGSSLYEILRARSARMRRVGAVMVVGVAVACAVVGLGSLRRRAPRPTFRRA